MSDSLPGQRTVAVTAGIQTCGAFGPNPAPGLKEAHMAIAA